MLYDEQDLLRTMDKIEPINYHQELEHLGVKFWCYNAGHVLGAAMFMVEIAGVKVGTCVYGAIDLIPLIRFCTLVIFLVKKIGI